MQSDGDGLRPLRPPHASWRTVSEDADRRTARRSVRQREKHQDLYARYGRGGVWAVAGSLRHRVISSSSLTAIRWTDDDLIDAGPGALWKDVCEVALSRNRTPPVLPDNLFISVGGTLNAAGLGETSYRLGAQVDHAVELDVVTGSGDLTTCSAARNAELFQMVLAGMGQCGNHCPRTSQAPARSRLGHRSSLCIRGSWCQFLSSGRLGSPRQGGTRRRNYGGSKS